MEEGEKNELYFLKSDGVIRKVYSNYIQIVLHYRFDYLMILVQTVTMPTVRSEQSWCDGGLINGKNELRRRTSTLLPQPILP